MSSVIPEQLPGTVASFPRAVNPQSGDLLSGMQINGPNKQYETVAFTVGQVGSAIGNTTFLPLAGGTMTGPLNVTATSSTVARSVQNQFADVANVLDYGADPSGAADSSAAFSSALATGRNVYAPAGTYRLNNQITLNDATHAQSLYGDGANTILSVDTSLDPSLTTGVINVLSGTHSDYPPTIADLAIRFAQTSDLIRQATATSAASTRNITVNSAAGVVVGMYVLDSTNRNAIPNYVYGNANITPTVTAVVGNVVTISADIADSGVGIGDNIQFGSARSMYKTIAQGGTAGPGGTGVKYPWAIYANTAQTLLVRNVMIENCWDGIYIRGSSFRLDQVDVGAFNIGIDIDQCYNFPQINDYRFWPWGYSTDSSRDASIAVYYDGQTIAANFGETDGLGCHNFQSWCGIVNLTTMWSWGSFTNMMMDGNNANLNILSSTGSFVQITNYYSTKGAAAIGPSITMNASETFAATIIGCTLTAAAAAYNGIVLQGGTLTLSDGYLWDGIQSSNAMISVTGGTLIMDHMRFDASAGRTDTYINLPNNTAPAATLRMRDCVWIAAPGTGAFSVIAQQNNTVAVDNIVWNGWLYGGPVNNQNNGSVFVSPIDASSMQAGSTSFNIYDSTLHYSTAFGQLALTQVYNSATYNTGVGSLAGYGVVTGGWNTFVGAASGYSPAGISGNFNTCLGASTGYSLTTGANNTLIGYYTDQSVLTTGSNNILIGSNAGIGSASTSNTINIGGIFTATGTDTPATAQISLNGIMVLGSGVINAANDAAAAAAGVPVNGAYRNGSQLMVRVS